MHSIQDQLLQAELLQDQLLQAHQDLENFESGSYQSEACLAFIEHLELELAEYSSLTHCGEQP